MGDITQLLHQWRSGDREAENELFGLVAPDLRRLAQYMMRESVRATPFRPPSSWTRSTSGWWQPRIGIGRTDAIFSLLQAELCADT